MSRFLQVKIEFYPSQGQESLTSHVISDSVRAIFADTGISEEAVSIGIEEVSLKKPSPLGIDPGTAAVLVALIGMSIELIKLGFELENRDKELAIKEREVALKEKELEIQQIPEEATEDSERRLVQEFVNRVLLVELMEQHNIQPTRVEVHIEER